MSERRYLVNGIGLIGCCVLSKKGWRFLPQIEGHRPSYKPHPTALACLPAWARARGSDLLDAEAWHARERKRKAAHGRNPQ